MFLSSTNTNHAAGQATDLATRQATGQSTGQIAYQIEGYKKNLFRIKSSFTNSHLKTSKFPLDINLYLMLYNCIKYI